MKDIIKGAVIASGLALAAWFLDVELGKAIHAGKSKRTVADMKSIANAVQRYRVDHGQYPVATRIEQLQALLEPQYLGTVPTWGLSYSSDGATYAISGTPFAQEVVGPQRFAPFHVRDGEFVSWPDYMDSAPR